MQAIISRESNVIITEVSNPTITASQCLIKVHYAGLNRADLLQVKGLYPPPPGASEILGLEFSGEIMEMGDQVEGFVKGDMVCSIVAGGAYAEYIAVESEHLIKVPKGHSLESAGAIPEAFITSYQSLVHIANISNGERILIHAGASGVGSAAIQMAKSIGCHVICTVSKSKHDYCYNLGADECVDYRAVEFDKVISDIDMVLDLIGGSYFQKNINVLNTDGRMVMLGFLGGVKAEETNIAGIVAKRLNIQGSTLRARSSDYKAMLIKGFVGQFLLDGRFPFETNVDIVFPFDQVKDAHTYMEENKNMGKILLNIH